MEKEIHFLIVDDDKFLSALLCTLLEKTGHKVTTVKSSEEALKQIIDLKPDCVLSDLILPGMDGLQLFQDLRKIKNISQPKFIILTGKQFDYDRRRALELGVDGYLTKPINQETFVEEILDILAGKMIIHFWGCRGTLPVPGEKTVRYGGNTNCVTLTFSNKFFFIFDAGTGIKELSNYLVAENKFPMSAKIFITHPHYDHINGIPLFVPFYMQGNEFEFFGPGDGENTIESLLSGQMDSVYFPVTMKEFGAKITFRNLAEEEFDIEDLHIKTIYLNHPGRCLGFRVEYKNKSFCYITDNELYPEDSEYYNQNEVDRLIKFLNGADVLVIDSTYNDTQYAKKIHWGHSCISRSVDIADKAKVKLLCLHHHDPDQADDDIDKKLAQAKQILESRHSKTRCIAPHEGDEISI